MHAEMHPEFSKAASLLQQFRNELARRRDAHAELVLRLNDGRVDSTTTLVRTPTEAAELLLAGEVPGTRADDLRAVQAEEEALRREVAAMEPLERRLADQVEICRVRAREAVVRSDPRTEEIRKAWRTAEAAVRAAVEIEQRQRADLLAGAFGSHEPVRPEWCNVNWLP